jgi:hypothetical protein
MSTRKQIDKWLLFSENKKLIFSTNPCRKIISACDILEKENQILLKKYKKLEMDLKKANARIKELELDLYEQAEAFELEMLEKESGEG